MIDRTREYKVEVKKQRNISGVQGVDSAILPSKGHFTQFTKNAVSVLHTIKQVTVPPTSQEIVTLINSSIISQLIT